MNADAMGERAGGTGSSVACGLGARVHDTREATRDIWGDASVDAVLGAIDDDTAARFRPSARVETWLPESYFMTWMEAVWKGPCGEDAESFARWADRITDRGFGTARRMLMSLASPWIILRRANALWRTEHTHGSLAVAPIDDKGARMELRDHPFLDSPRSRAAVSEAFRFIVVCCRTRGVEETHDLAPDGALHVTLRWR